VTAGVIAQLERQLPLEALGVGDARFCFHPAAPWPGLGAADLRVPGTKASLQRECYLRAPAQTWAEFRLEPLEQSLRGRIPQRVARRVDLHAQIQPEHREPCSDVRKRHAVDLPAFEPPQLAFRAPRGSGCSPQAEPSCDASLPVLRPQTTSGPSHPPPTSIAWSLARSHTGAASRDGLIRRSPARASRDAGQATAEPSIKSRFGASGGRFPLGPGHAPVEAPRSEACTPVVGPLARHEGQHGVA
jgi:hypothetical protein